MYVNFPRIGFLEKLLEYNAPSVREAFSFHASEQQDISECFSVLNILID